MPLTKVNLVFHDGASELQRIRKSVNLPIPKVLESVDVAVETHEALGAFGDHEDIERLFPTTYGRPRVSIQPSPDTIPRVPLRIGVVLSGGQAPGGHNVIAGIFDYAKKVHPDSELFGFLDGPQGVYKGNYAELTKDIIDFYRNSGGFDMIGSGRHKIEKEQDFISSMNNCIALGLHGLVIIGGDDSNTNAAVLAEFFESKGCTTKVCGCPKTIDGDLKVDPYIPISFGFDSACKTYSELIGNLCEDTLSSQKYYHFVRLMGRAASNIALECALMTRPNVCLISEEIQHERKTLQQLTADLVAVISARAADEKNYGVVLLPEGLIEFIPEFTVLISELNDILDTGVDHVSLPDHLTEPSRAVFDYLPQVIKEQLLLDRDPHGNVQVTKIETERLLAQTVSIELEKLRAAGSYSGSFIPQFHSYGYEGRSCLPSTFDSIYCYALGQNVTALIVQGQNGLISSITNLTAPVADWQCGGVPITMMCHMEKRHAHMKPVINKALVELNGEPFKCFAANRDTWSRYDVYRVPGPIQFFQSDEVDLCITLTLELRKYDRRMDPSFLEAAIAAQRDQKRFGQFSYFPVVGAGSDLYSPMQLRRCLQFQPILCPALVPNSHYSVQLGQPTNCRRIGDRSLLLSMFPNSYAAPIASLQPIATQAGAAMDVDISATITPLTIGVVFCGRQAPGGLDVISGIFDALPAGSRLIGFVGGTVGLFSNSHVEITRDLLQFYRGQGGYKLLCRSADKISKSDFPSVFTTCNALELDGLVMIGGTRTSANAAHVAEYGKVNQYRTRILTVPVDISNSLKSEFVETMVGFDTASKVSGQVVGNNATDGASAKKYYYFIRLMGDEPSHNALEVALTTKPNVVILAEEVSAKRMSLADIVKSIADVVNERARLGLNYGVVLLPEGIVEVIPELTNLIAEIDGMYIGAPEGQSLDSALVKSQLTLWSRAILESLPDYMQSALLLSRGSNNAIQLSQAQTERMLAYFVEVELNYRKSKGLYKGTFSAICSFIGYQARGASPSNFDVNYAYNLGAACVRYIAAGLSGYLITISNLKAPINEWQVTGVPIVSLFEHDPVTGATLIPKTMVDVHGPAYAALVTQRKTCTITDQYENPGPIQYTGPAELTDSVSKTLQAESFEYLADFKQLKSHLSVVEESCRPGCSPTLLRIVVKSLSALTDIVSVMQQKETNTR